MTEKIVTSEELAEMLFSAIKENTELRREIQEIEKRRDTSDEWRAEIQRNREREEIFTAERRAAVAREIELFEKMTGLIESIKLKYVNNL